MPAIDTQGPKKKLKKKKPASPGPSDVQSGGHEVGPQAPRRPVRTGSRGDSPTERRPPPKPRPVAGPPAPRRTPPKDTKSEKEFQRAEHHKKSKDYKRKLRKTREERQERQQVSPVRGREVAGPPAPSESLRRRLLERRLERENKSREIKARVPRDASPSELSERIRKGRDLDRGLEVLKKRKEATAAKKMAPVVDVLEETTRPIHAVAGGTRAAIRGESIPKAIKRGAQNKDKYLFSDVLKEAGVPKKVAGPAGFVLDVAADPTTYVTGGIGATTARKSILKSAEKSAKKAAPKAARAPTPKEARRAAERARGGGAEAPTLAQRAQKRAVRQDPRRGVAVRVAGKEVPGVRRVTSKAAAPLRTVGRTKPAQTAKEAVREVRPTLTPRGVPREEFQEVRRATRTARAKSTRGTFRAQQKAAGLKKVIGEKNNAAVIDAIESGTVKKLPEHLRGPAKRVQDEFKHARRLQRRAGVKVPERKGYVPHQLSKQGLKEKGVEEGTMAASNVGRRVIKPSSSKARKEQRSLKELREQEPGKYSENLPELYAKRMDDATTSAARADLNRRVADVGRIVTRNKDLELKRGEAVFHVRGSDIRKVSDKTEVQKLIDEGPKSGRYVVLNEEVVEQAMGGVRPKLKGGPIAKGTDVATGWWKFLATVPNPGFHVRNLLGDTQNAFLAENALKLARNIGTSGRTLKRLHKQEESLRAFGKEMKPTRGTVKIQGEKVSLDDLAKEAEKVGAVRTGFIARELPELQTAMKKGAKPARGVGRRAGRALQSREDLIRLATYIGGRKKGLSPERAAERSTKYHFDYADLTGLERNVLRRIAPFYTFSARNIPLQFKSLLTKPGKYAQYEKIREEFGKAFDVAPGFEGDLSEYEQRGAPIPIKWKGKDFTLSLGPSGLPLADLNEVPTSSNPAKALEEWMARGMSMVNPGVKAPVEIWSNFSFFLRDQLERDEGPLVPAPGFVTRLPKSVQESLGVVNDYVDKRSGKKGPAWPAKTDYLANILPGPLNFLQNVQTSSDRPGQTTGHKVAAYGGVRVRPVEKETTRIGNLYDERGEVEKKMAAWRQRGVSAKQSNKQYDKLRVRQREINAEIAGLKKKRGDKVLKKKTKPRVSGSSGGFKPGGYSGYSSEGFQP